MTHTLHLGDCRDVLATMGDATVDAIVCDPPYELGFMGKSWDASGIAYDVTVWAHCLRVLKPGGHLIAFGGSRTYHRLAVAIEDAGFEIRDQIQWIYGSGFPKSLDVSKAMDKQAGAVRDVVGEYSISGMSPDRVNFGANDRSGGKGMGFRPGDIPITAPATDLAKRWHGWGTALKPAHEPAVLARKPLRGTVADNVTAWGVGALNIEGTRVGNNGQLKWSAPRAMGFSDGTYADEYTATQNPAGRWPSNVILDEEAAQVLDGQSGEVKYKPRGPNKRDFKGWKYAGELQEKHSYNYPGTGGASRFFYVAKASKAEREAGLDGVATVEKPNTLHMKQGNSPQQTPHTPPTRANHHPTVKPLALMRYLVRMVTPPGGVVLDPFMGSGSTGCAAVREGFDFVGIDLTPEYVAIAQKRIDWHAVTSPLDNIATMELHEENDA